jgi:NAD(P)-dependent dehydrogenase (short-subunit alcohol dehydrogenase family)
VEPDSGDQFDRLFSVHSARRSNDEGARERQHHQYFRCSGERSSPGGAAYSVSKGAINSLTRQAAADLAPTIRVNAVISGLVGTPIGQKEMGNRRPEYDIIPLRRIGRPEDVAEAAVFLASDKASYITNAILPVDGGRLNSMSSGSSR